VQQQLPIQREFPPLDGADTTTVALIEEQHQEIPAEIIPPSENTSNKSNVIAQHSFSMPLVDVTDTVARTVVVYDDPVITPVNPLEVTHITAAPDAMVNPTLEKNMDFMNNWLK